MIQAGCRPWRRRRPTGRATCDAQVGGQQTVVPRRGRRLRPGRNVTRRFRHWPPQRGHTLWAKLMCAVIASSRSAADWSCTLRPDSRTRSLGTRVGSIGDSRFGAVLNSDDRALRSGIPRDRAPSRQVLASLSPQPASNSYPYWRLTWDGAWRSPPWGSARPWARRPSCECEACPESPKLDSLVTRPV